MASSSRVVVLTAGDAKFRPYIELTLAAARRFNYSSVVYDLDDLGIGERFAIDDPLFRETGYYGQIPGTTKRTKARHKPQLLSRCGLIGSHFIAYLDGDAVLRRPIDHLADGSFDIGVTVRKKWEIRYFSRHEDEFKRQALGYLNAGVIFFQPTPGAKEFLQRWQELTASSGNDQYALNTLAAPLGKRGPPKRNELRTVDGIRIRFLPGSIYNNFYINKHPVLLRLGDRFTRIYHFRGGRARRRFELVRKAFLD